MSLLSASAPSHLPFSCLLTLILPQGLGSCWAMPSHSGPFQDNSWLISYPIEDFQE